MIYDISLPFIIIFSIFSIIIILARKIPDISLEAEVKKDLLGEQAKKQHRMTVLFCKALSILEKTLRQLRIHILKLDAKIFGLIQYLREKSAKKLEEINKLSYKSFTPAIQKKTDKSQLKSQLQAETPAWETTNAQIQPETKIETQPEIKIQTVQAVENKKDILSDDPEFKIAQKMKSSPKMKIIKTIRQLSKISTKFQFNIEERKLLHIIAKNPKNAENYKKLGMLYYENENFSDAEAAFNEYLKLNPSDFQVRETVKEIVIKNQGKKF